MQNKKNIHRLSAIGQVYHKYKIDIDTQIPGVMKAFIKDTRQFFCCFSTAYTEKQVGGFKQLLVETVDKSTLIH